MKALSSMSREQFDAAWSSRPATRIGRTVLLPDGAVIQLSRIQRVLFALGLRRSI